MQRTTLQSYFSRTSSVKCEYFPGLILNPFIGSELAPNLTPHGRPRGRQGTTVLSKVFPQAPLRVVVWRHFLPNRVPKQGPTFDVNKNTSGFKQVSFWTPTSPKNKPRINQNDLQTVQVGTLRTQCVTCNPTWTPKRPPRGKCAVKCDSPGPRLGSFWAPKLRQNVSQNRGEIWMSKSVTSGSKRVSFWNPKSPKVLQYFKLGRNLRNVIFIY